MCGSFGQVAACTPAQQRRPGGRACCTHGLPLPRQEQRLGGGSVHPWGTGNALQSGCTGHQLAPRAS